MLALALIETLIRHSVNWNTWTSAAFSSLSKWDSFNPWLLSSVTHDSRVKGGNSLLHHLDAVVALLRVHWHETIRTKPNPTGLWMLYTWLVWVYHLIIYCSDPSAITPQDTQRVSTSTPHHHHTQLSHEYKPLSYRSDTILIDQSEKKTNIGINRTSSKISNIIALIISSPISSRASALYE